MQMSFSRLILRSGATLPFLTLHKIHWTPFPIVSAFIKIYAQTLYKTSKLHVFLRLADRIILASKTIENSSKKSISAWRVRRHFCREISLFKAHPRTVTARADCPPDSRWIACVPDLRLALISGNPDVRKLIKAGVTARAS